MPDETPMNTEEKIIDALRAAPPHIAASAAVVDHDMVTVLRRHLRVDVHAHFTAGAVARTRLR